MCSLCIVLYSTVQSSSALEGTAQCCWTSPYVLVGAGETSFSLWSCFTRQALEAGLSSQKGRGHAWHTFGGKLSCATQEEQLALTPPLSYAWWDAPWQSPLHTDLQLMRLLGLNASDRGHLTNTIVESWCQVPAGRFRDIDLTPKAVLSQ